MSTLLKQNTEQIGTTSTFQTMKRVYGDNRFLSINSENFGNNIPYTVRETIIDPISAYSGAIGSELIYKIPPNRLLNSLRLQQTFASWGGTASTLAFAGMVQKVEFLYRNSTAIQNIDKETLYATSYGYKDPNTRDKLDESGSSSTTIWTTGQIVSTNIPFGSNLGYNLKDEPYNALFYTHDDNYTIKITLVSSLANIGTSTGGTVTVPTSMRMSIKDLEVGEVDRKEIVKSYKAGLKPIYEFPFVGQTLNNGAGTGVSSLKILLTNLKNTNLAAIGWYVYDTTASNTNLYNTPFPVTYTGSIEFRDSSDPLLKYENIDAIVSQEQDTFGYAFDSPNLHLINFGVNSPFDINDSNSINVGPLNDINLYFTEIGGLIGGDTYRIAVFGVTKSALKIGNILNKYN